jgi:hypothetical protein
MFRNRFVVGVLVLVAAMMTTKNQCQAQTKVRMVILRVHVTTSHGKPAYGATVGVYNFYNQQVGLGVVNIGGYADIQVPAGGPYNVAASWNAEQFVSRPVYFPHHVNVMHFRTRKS